MLSRFISGAAGGLGSAGVPLIKLFGLATVLLLLVLPRTDDTDTGSLGGRISDENQEAIKGAMVSATNVFSHDVDIAQSDETGFYKLTALRQGRYSVFAKAEGHGCTWVFNVLLFRGQHTKLDLTLRRSTERVRSEDCMTAARNTQ